MKRTDSDGATVTNLFTNGNPGLGVPATVVDDNWLNSIQEEMALFIESQGITLDQTGVDFTQFQQALNNFVGSGGVGVADFSIANNTTTQTDVTGLVFDKLETKSARVLFDIHRETDSEELDEVGEMFIVYKPKSDSWTISLDSKLDDAGVIFSVTSSGQVQYTSSNLAGGSYVGTLKMKDVTKTAI